MIMLDVSFCAGITDQDVKNYMSVSNCMFVLSFFFFFFFSSPAVSLGFTIFG